MISGESSDSPFMLLRMLLIITYIIYKLFTIYSSDRESEVRRDIQWRREVHSEVPRREEGSTDTGSLDLVREWKVRSYVWIVSDVTNCLH